MTSSSLNNEYDLKAVNLPYLAGPVLRLFASALEGPLAGLLLSSLLQNLGILKFRELQIDDPPTPQPIHFVNDPAPETARVPEVQYPAGGGKSTPYASTWDFAEAYRSGSATPEDVAERVLQAVEASNNMQPPMRAMIAVQHDDVRRQAAAAAKRYQEGRPLSVLDGVPVVIKDELDMMPYPTTVGTSFLGKQPVQEDAAVVARLRAAGALLVGKANMHEIGIGVTGINPNLGTARNPHNPGHYTGGSSSGSAAAAAMGLAPITIGADGGGSIRIPSALCGVVGLKATYGRVSEHGAAPLCWSVAHVGPLAATAADAALAYAVIAGPDPRDPNSLHQPPPVLDGWDTPGLEGVRLGVYWPWFRHATPDVVGACEEMLAKFEALGATVHEVEIPNLEAARVAQGVIIATEMATSLDRTYGEHRRDHGLDVRINLAIARNLQAMDYVRAQQVRTRLIGSFDHALKKVHMVLTPTTGLASPAIPSQAIPDGESNLNLLTELMRFVTPSNLTGHPAISFPAGYGADGMPVGMQAIGRAWDEPMLLRLALAAEGEVERRLPQVHYPLL